MMVHQFLSRVLPYWLLLAPITSAFAADPVSRFAENKSIGGPLPPFDGNRFVPLDEEVIVWIGSENSVIEQEHGWIETHLLAALHAQNKRAVLRHMGWEGDTVYRQNRMMNWGSWQENLAAVDGATVFVWFGAMESLQPDRTTADFIAAYEKLLDELSLKTRRIVLISPIPFEKPRSPLVPELTARNATLNDYVHALKSLASRRGCLVIDLFSPLLERAQAAVPRTRDGIHLTAAGLKEVAPIFLTSLGFSAAQSVDEKVRSAVIEKNRIWFDTWRPMNWAFAYGDRTTQPFAQAVPGRPAFVDELKKNRPLMVHSDATIRALLAGSPLPKPLPIEPTRSDPPALSPEEQKSRFKVREGFAVDLFADEKNGVIRPVQIRWDERGRLWVVCAPSYPHLQPGEKANDFILVLEDTDGDGRADKSFRWAERLKMPMGIEFGSDGVYVCENSQLVYLRDTNGDNRADERTVLLSGFGTGDSHQTANSIRWGADGHLWFSQGYHIWSYVETPHGIVELNRSGLWRLNPRTLKLESFLNESTAGLNCWGVAFDDYGQVFHGSGADVAIWHTTPGLVPTLQPLSLGAGLARSRGKSMEPEFLGSSHLPAALDGVLLKSIYFTSQVGLYRLRDDGAGFVSEDLGDLISSSGPEFRPLETRVGPDGAIYICDWLNAVIGHYQASYRDARRDRSHGRIWRMTAVGRKTLPRPALERMSTAELLEQLHSRERWNRDHAKFLLYRKAKSEVLPVLKRTLDQAFSSSNGSERLLYELSGVLAAHEEPSALLIERMLASIDFRWRAWGVRLVGLWADRLVDPLSYLKKGAFDSHPRVRMEAAVAASSIPRAEAIDVATHVLEQPMDRSIDHALTLTTHHLASHWRPALNSGKLDFGGRYDALSRILSTVGDTNFVSRLRELLSSGKITGRSRENLLAVLVTSGNTEDMNFAVTQATESGIVLNALVAAANRRPTQTSAPILEALFTNVSPAARIAACRVVEAWGEAFGLTPIISRIVSDPSSSPPELASAIPALGKVKGREAWSEIVPRVGHSDQKVRGAALSALAALDLKSTAAHGADLFVKAQSASDAGTALSPFFNVKDGVALLTQAFSLRPSRS
jgi:HEAT repeat protein